MKKWSSWRSLILLLVSSILYSKNSILYFFPFKESTWRILPLGWLRKYLIFWDKSCFWRGDYFSSMTKQIMVQTCWSTLWVIGSGVLFMKLGVLSTLKFFYFLLSHLIYFLFHQLFDFWMMLRKELKSCRNCSVFVVVWH